MSDRYPGGLIRKTPPTITPPVDGEGGSAPGIWTLEQASYQEGVGNWPKPVLPGTLYGFGQADNGVLAADQTVDVSSPVQVTDKTNWAQISGPVSSYSNFKHVLAVTQTGELYSWGLNNQGQLGDGTKINRSSPTQVGALTNWSLVNAGREMSLAIKTDGTLWAWGDGDSGKLGDNTTIDKSSPIQVGARTDWTKLAGGSSFTLAIAGGELYAWGANTNGRLGINVSSVGGDRSSPTQVGALTTWLNVAAGYYHGFAVKTDNTLWSWGKNIRGILGTNQIGTTTIRSSPVQVGALTNWLKGDTSYGTATFIKTDGTMWSWGGNAYYTTGLADLINRSSPVQVGSDTWLEVGVNYVSMAAIKYDKTLWTCGSNSFGQTGQNTAAGDTIGLTQVGSETTWNKVFPGDAFHIFLKKG
jgi:alpha-tubulin suppressor-like RCC1 family protein